MKYFNIHTHDKSHPKDVVAIVNQYPDEFDDEIKLYSVGIHPWRIDKMDVSESLEFIETRKSDKGFVAIGECGLDKRIDTPIKTQIEVFEKQLDMAQKLQKPVIVHLVAAFDELISIKKNMNFNLPMVIHGFSKNYQVAKMLLNVDCHLSFGKYLLRNPDLKETFVKIPREKIFLETDTIEETIYDVYKKAEQYLELDREELDKIIDNNFNSVFGTELKS